MRNESVTFEIDGLPPTSNHAFVKAGRGWYPSKALKEWKSKVEELVNGRVKIKDSEWYEVERVYYMPLYYKNGNQKKKDVSNMDKYADDELCKLLETYGGQEIDDHEIVSGTHVKVDCKEGEEKTVWTIWTTDESV